MIDSVPRRSLISFSVLAAMLCCGIGEALAIQKKDPKNKSTASKTKTQLKKKIKLSMNPSLARLVDSDVAKSLNLSDEQRAKASNLLNERLAAIAKAKSETNKNKVKAEFQQKFADLLTPSQLKQALTIKPIPKLVFDFRFQKWEDVLDWYATEADLSLVMPGGPPPATFNFSDTKEYTPTEALDLLNSVLSTKDFILIRRGRMLMVLDISDGVPQGVVPEIKLEELEERGKYEIVKVKFPLGRRDVSGVDNEIKPMLGRHGKAIPLPLTKQLLVQAPAGVMKAISIVINDIPEPPAPKTPVKPPEPSPPEIAEFRTYQFKNSDPVKAKEIAEKFFPDIKIVQNPNAAELNVFTVPSQHKTIKLIFDKLENSNAPSVRPKLEIYPFPTGDAEQIMETLKLLAKTAVMRFNPTTKKLEVVGTPKEHEAIKENLPLLTGRRTGPFTKIPGYRQVQSYKIKHVELSAITQTLQTIFPNAFITSDAGTKTVIVFTSAEDQRGVKNIIDSLDKSDKTDLDIKSIPYAETPSTTLTTTFTKIAPQSSLNYDADAKRFIFIGPKEELPKVEATIKLFAASHTAKEKNKLTIYPVTAIQKARFNSVLADIQKELLGIKVMAETNLAELAIWAKPEQHKVLGPILKELAGTKTVGVQSLKGYELKDSDSTQTLDLLKQIFPTLSFIPDTNTKRLMLMADDTTHKDVKKAFDQIVTEKPKSIYRSYPLDPVYPANIVTILTKQVPNAQITQDDSSQRIVVVAPEKDQTAVKTILDDIQKYLGPSEKNTLAIYPITPTQKKRLDAVQADMLTQLPGVKIMPKTNPGEIAVWAKPSQHKILKEMIDALGKGESIASESLKGYGLKDSDGPQTITLLQKVFSTLTFIHDANTKRLMVVTDAKTHEKVRDAIEQIVTVEENPTFKVYDFGNADTTQLQTTLQSLVPNAKLFVDADNHKISAMATAIEHKEIKKVVDAVKPGISIETTEQVVVYRLKKADPQTTMTLLQGLFPKATFAVDAQTKSIVVVAIPKDHSGIKTLVDQVDTEEGTTLKLYPLSQNLPTNIITILTKLAPNAQITQDETSRQIMVVASIKDQVIVESTIKQFQAQPREKRILSLYQMSQSQLKRFDAVEADIKKGNLGITIIKDTQQGEVSIWATFTQHQSIKETIDQITKGKPVDRKQQLAAYSLQLADPETAEKILKSLFESIKVIPEKETRQLFIWATPENHKSIDIIIKSIDSQGAAGGKKKFRVWPTEGLDPTVTTNVLKQAFPKVTFAADSTAGTIIAQVNEKQGQEITDLVKQLIDTSGAASNKTVARRYKAKFARSRDGRNFVQSLVPTAQVHVDVTGGYVTILATEKDHELLKEIFDKGEFLKEKIFRVYSFNVASTKDALKVVRANVPDATYTLGTVGKKLFVSATSPDHEKLEPILAMMEDGRFSGDNSLRRYETKFNSRGNIRKLLLNMITTGIVVTNDASTKYIWVLASKEEHKLVTQIMDQMNSDNQRDGTEYKNYDIVHSTTKNITASITKRHPDVVFWPCSVKNRLILEATPMEHAEIKVMIDMLEKQNEIMETKIEKIYSLENLAPAQAQKSLNQTVSSLTFLPINLPKKLYISAEPKQHELVIKRLKQLEIANAPLRNTSLQKYLFQHTTAAAIKKYVASRMIGITFQNGPDANTLFSEVTKEDDLKIRDLVSQLEAAYKKDDTRKLRTFDVKKSGTSTAQSVITSLVPGTTFLPGGDTKTLLALLTDKEDTRIAEIVKQLESQYDSKERSPKSYTIKSISLADARTTITAMFTQATMLKSDDPMKLIVLATQTEHTAIGKTLSQIDIGNQTDKLTLQSYSVKYTGASAAQTILTQTIKNVTFIPSADGLNLMAWATTVDHAIIKQVLERLEIMNLMPNDKVLRTYLVEGTTVADMRSVLPTMFPKVTITASSDPKKILVTASLLDHTAIKIILDKLAEDKGRQRSPKSYTLKNMSVTDARTTISTLFAQATMLTSDDPKKLIVLATDPEHILIGSMLKRLDDEYKTNRKITLVTYDVENTTAPKAQQVLLQKVKNVEFIATPDGTKLMAWATTEEHKMIKVIIDALEKSNRHDFNRTVKTYTVTGTTVADMQSVLPEMFPKATFTASSDPDKLIVTAKPDDHAAIKQILDEIAKGSSNDQLSLKSYSVRYTGAISAQSVLSQTIKNVKFIPSADALNLMAWATVANHTKIKQIVEELEITHMVDQNKVLRTYLVEGAAVKDMRSVLPSMFPNVTLTAGSEPNTLIVTGNLDDQASIKAVLDQLRKNKDAKHSPRTYTVKNITVADARTTITNMFTQAKLLSSNDPLKFIVLASDKDHQEIAKILKSLEDQNGPKGVITLVTYVAENTTATNAIKILTLRIPDVTYIPTPDGTKLMVWANAKQHKEIKTIMDDLEEMNRPDFMKIVTTYEIVGATVVDIQTVLTAMFPKAMFTVSSEPNKLIITASESDHTAIKSILAGVENDKSKEKRSLVSYDVENTGASSAQAALSKTVKNVTYIPSTNGTKLMAWANEAQHKIIKVQIVELEKNNQPASNHIVKSYEVIGATVADIQSVLKKMFSNANFTVGSEPNKLIVAAKQSDHDSIKQILDSLEKDRGKSKRSIVSYDVEYTGAVSAETALSKTVKNVTFIASADKIKLMAWATVEQHKEIKPIIEKLEESNRTDNNRVVVIYDVIGAEVTDMRSVLTTMYPNAILTAGSEPNKLIVSAKQTDHVAIKAILDRVKNDRGQDGRTIVSYDVEYTGATSARTALKETMKNVEFIASTDGTKLMAWATTIQHKKIRAIVELLETSNQKAGDWIVKTYLVKGVTVADVSTALAPMFPKSNIVASSEPNKVVITAKTDDHIAIRRILEILGEENADPDRSLKSYNVENTGANNAENALSEILKNVSFIPSADKKRLMAWATTKEHILIDTTVKEFEKANRRNHDRIVMNYIIEGASVADMRSLLATKYPEATFKSSSERNRLIALATLFEHEDIAKILSEVRLNKKGNLTLTTYEVPNTGAINAQKVLTLAFQQVKSTVGNDKEKLFVLATLEDHKKIAVMVDGLESSGITNRDLIMKVYKAVATGAANAKKILEQAYPKAKFYTGVDPSKLIIWAKEEEHKKMKGLIADLEIDDSRKRESKAYSIGENVDAQTIAAMLAPLKRENVTITTDAQLNMLIALATSEQHVQINKAINQFLKAIPESAKLIPEVYRLEFADPNSARTVLTALVPKAKIAIDAGQKSLFITAIARDHAMIKATVAKLDDPNANIGRKNLKTHLFNKYEPRNLETIVKAVFQKDKTVSLSMDASNKVLIAVATQRQHKMIEDLIVQLEATLSTGKETREFYALTGGLDAGKVEGIVRNMLKLDGFRAQISRETFTNQLIVFAEPKVHKKIEEILTKLAKEAPGFEVFQLENIDPTKAAEAIDALFDNSDFKGNPGAPIISGDDTTGQIYVRATKEQIKKIKDLLRKMGETNLDTSTLGDNRKIRKIRIDGDMQKAIEDAIKLWNEMQKNRPGLKKNPIKVIGSQNDSRVRDARKKLKELQKKKKGSKEEGSSLNQLKNNLSFVSLNDETKPTANQKTKTSNQPKNQQKNAPIFIFLGPGQITLASDDVEALNEFEKLLNSLKPRRGFSGRNYTVFMLRNAGARVIAESLKDLFKSTEGSGVNSGPVVVVPDERLNAIVIHANRSDRAMVESLLEILDSEDIIDSKSLVKPRRILVKNTRASRVAVALRDIYRTHLTSGGGRKAIPIPTGIAPGLAAILQQVNATNTGPLMTLTVDETSNSVIVMAPASLTDEVEALINELDEASVNDRPAQTIKIIQLQKAKAASVGRYLQQFRRRSTGRRRR